jgi:hypothetical protein
VLGNLSSNGLRYKVGFRLSSKTHHKYLKMNWFLLKALNVRKEKLTETLQSLNSKLGLQKTGHGTMLRHFLLTDLLAQGKLKSESDLLGLGQKKTSGST